MAKKRPSAKRPRKPRWAAVLFYDAAITALLPILTAVVAEVRT
jgi:hypothetical protein